MAFIHNELAVIRHKIGYIPLPHQALDGGDIDHARRPFPAAKDDPDTVRVDVEECT